MTSSQHKRRKAQQNRPQLLDQFSERDIRSWLSISEELKEYWYRLHYHLLGLQQAHINVLCDSLLQTQSVFIKVDNWIRIVDHLYTLEPLSAKGSLINGGRFNIGKGLDNNPFPAFPALYIAENYDTAYLEKFGGTTRHNKNTLSGEEFSLRKSNSFSSIRLNGELHQIFDLTRTNNLNKFTNIIKTFKMPSDLKALTKKLNIPPPYLITKPSHLKRSFMATSWQHFPIMYDMPSNSQIFARILILAGFEGILYRSSKSKNNCVAVLLDNFDDSESHINLSDPAPTQVKHTKLDKNNWKDLI